MKIIYQRRQNYFLGVPASIWKSALMLPRNRCYQGVSERNCLLAAYFRIATIYKKLLFFKRTAWPSENELAFQAVLTCGDRQEEILIYMQYHYFLSSAETFFMKWTTTLSVVLGIRGGIISTWKRDISYTCVPLHVIRGVQVTCVRYPWSVNGHLSWIQRRRSRVYIGGRPTR